MADLSIINTMYLVFINISENVQCSLIPNNLHDSNRFISSFWSLTHFLCNLSPNLPYPKFRQISPPLSPFRLPHHPGIHRNLTRFISLWPMDLCSHESRMVSLGRLLKLGDKFESISRPFRRNLGVKEKWWPSPGWYRCGWHHSKRASERCIILLSFFFYLVFLFPIIYNLVGKHDSKRDFEECT